MAISIWVWILIAVVVIVLIVVIVMVARKQSAVQNRERAAELRERASNNDQLIGSRRDRADELDHKADEARDEALTASDRADALRVQAGESDEQAARATEQAEILDDEAAHSRESYEEAVDERDEALLEADRRDPDVHTDRHGNRVEDAEVVADDADEVVDEPTAVVASDDERFDDAPAVTHDSTPAVTSDDERFDGTPAVVDEPAVIPESDVLDADDDYSADEFAEPDADYIDPVDHDRLAREDNGALFASDETAADTTVDDGAIGDPASVDDVGRTGSSPAPIPGTVTDAEPPMAARRMEYSPAEDELVEDTPLLDPYGNPVSTHHSGQRGWNDGAEDIPRDEQGRRLDPYGNPVPEDRDN
ncbi:MAG: hypothetical protein ABIS84_04930 [Arachnia sp.]